MSKAGDARIKKVAKDYYESIYDGIVENLPDVVKSVEELTPEMLDQMYITESKFAKRQVKKDATAKAKKARPKARARKTSG